MDIKQIFSGDKKTRKKIQKRADAVLALADTMAAKSDDELRAMTDEFRERLANGQTLRDIEAEAFAVCREAARRVRGEYPFPVQIMGAVAMENGDVAEMKTGEGKTLTATMAVYLHALTGRGVHVVTVNEYLSHRDAESMGLIYNFLGLTVGCNSASLDADEKREQYARDITYTTNSELGFDYLRDNMVFDTRDKVQRGLYFALVDEADSILIDEARTPLIIAQNGEDQSTEFARVDAEVKKLGGDDYRVFIKEKQVALTPAGISRLQTAFGVKNLYDPKNQDLLHKINKSLHANVIMQKDVDYLVRGDEIALIDQFTGRVMQGHAYSEGLQQAIQAKEGVPILPENKTAATITYQNFFRLYEKLAGMTGTAKTEEEEFLSIYNMYVTPIPTNKPVIREDKLDAVYRTKEIKFKNVVKEVGEAYKAGRPVLIGTVDVETNEYLSGLLDKAGIPHETLNAKNHEKEAEIIAKAGFPHSVTLATNMAGRGTDIKLTAESRALGGLYVIGTERHESRRIDNQLRGRSGRQGDPGTSIFFVSLEDDLMKRYGGPSIQKMFEHLVGEDRLESRSLSRSITNAQKMVEGYNFDVRKQLIEYDDVLRKQREIFFERREKMVNDEGDALLKDFHRYFETGVRKLFYECGPELEDILYQYNNQYMIINPDFHSYTMPQEIVTFDELKACRTDEEKIARLHTALCDYFDRLTGEDEAIRHYCLEIGKSISLTIMDRCWVDHIDYMDKMRNAIGLRSYAQRRPIDEYKDEGYRAFSNLIAVVSEAITTSLVTLRPHTAIRPAVMAGAAGA